jgi:hypothetical protein
MLAAWRKPGGHWERGEITRSKDPDYDSERLKNEEDTQMGFLPLREEKGGGDAPTFYLTTPSQRNKTSILFHDTPHCECVTP